MSGRTHRRDTPIAILSPGPMSEHPDKQGRPTLSMHPGHRPHEQEPIMIAS